MMQRRGGFRTRRRGVRSRAPAAGFTLVEMLVSMAVLIVALTVVGMVFSVTTKTATTAAAMAEVQAWVREWERQVGQDLKFVDPASSVLVLVGRTQAAALTEDDLQAGKFLRYLVGDPTDPQLQGYDPVFDPDVDQNGQYSNPRADLMMFYTMRASASQAPPLQPSNPPNPYLAGARFAPLQIVYGHAARGEVDWSSTPPFSSNMTHIEQVVGGGTNKDKQSILPANRWHLARRATIIEPESAFNSLKRSFTGPEFTRITRCLADGNVAGDVARLNWQLYLATLGARNSATFDLLQIPQQPYLFDPATGSRETTNRIDEAIFDVLYPRGRNDEFHHVATILEEPPLELRSNLGLHLLPSCAWFQVEFLMPEDPRNSLDYYNPDPSQPPATSFSSRYDTPRWTEVKHDETYVFLPDTAENRRAIALSSEVTERLGDFAFANPIDPGNPFRPVESRRIRLWPYAIRLTVRVYDSRNRLEEPIVRSIVHRFE